MPPAEIVIERLNSAAQMLQDGVARFKVGA
jgi:hypothetical protein